jgi:hypothetical protein
MFSVGWLQMRLRAERGRQSWKDPTYTPPPPPPGIVVEEAKKGGGVMQKDDDDDENEAKPIKKEVLAKWQVK